MDWAPANKQEVLTALEEDWVGIDPAVRVRLSSYLVDPRPASIERFGKTEQAFVVAQIKRHVVFFDDIEGDFGTAEEEGGKLSNTAAYGNIALALRELEQQASADS